MRQINSNYKIRLSFITCYLPLIPQPQIWLIHINTDINYIFNSSIFLFQPVFPSFSLHASSPFLSCLYDREQGNGRALLSSTEPLSKGCVYRGHTYFFGVISMFIEESFCKRMSTVTHPFTSVLHPE